jgi:hypothetical protein
MADIQLEREPLVWRRQDAAPMIESVRKEGE